MPMVSHTLRGECATADKKISKLPAFEHSTGDLTKNMGRAHAVLPPCRIPRPVGRFPSQLIEQSVS